jgi:putative phosphonate metabolism protein
MKRYAVYYLAQGPLAAFGASWLGWNVETAAEVAQPALPGLDLAALTETPRRYGFHATIKPPFRLAEGRTEEALGNAVAALCARLRPAEAEALRLGSLGHFLALTPEGDASAISALAAETVRALDDFRAPAPESELARRRVHGLGPAQEANLAAWGYPYVLDEFRFHMTLSGSLDAATLAAMQAALVPRLEALLPRPFRLDALCLAGEAADGCFRLIRRYSLTG